MAIRDYAEEEKKQSLYWAFDFSSNSIFSFCMFASPAYRHDER